MAILIAFLILGSLSILQTTIVSRIALLSGTADLVLLALISWTLQKRVQTAWHWSIIGGLLAGVTSALPAGVPIIGYGLTTWIALLVRQRIWRIQTLAMFVVTFIGTLIIHALSIFSLRLIGNPIPIWEAINLITLPSLLLNLLLSIPIYALIGDLASWLYPEEIEV